MAVFTTFVRLTTRHRLEVLLALLPLLVPGRGGGASQAAAPHAQPALLTMAVRHLRATVHVIVQQARHATGMEALVARLGGRVTAKLPIINAFAATLAARAVPELARAPGVRWVSPDAPVD